MNINTNGLVDRVEITSFGDNTGANMILGVIKLSKSKWINHSGKDQVVNFQIYFIPGEEPTPNFPVILPQYYADWGSKPVIHFDPVICRFY